jgi:hypothetical protein
MPGALIKLDEAIISSTVSSVMLGGAQWDSSYNIYKLLISNVISSETISGRLILTKDVSGTQTPVTTAEYDYAGYGVRNDSYAFADLSEENHAYWNYIASWSTDGSVAGQQGNAEVFLYNMNESSRFSMMTAQTTTKWDSGNLGATLGGSLNVTEAHNGVKWYPSAGTISKGTFSLYGLRK